MNTAPAQAAPEVQEVGPANLGGEKRQRGPGLGWEAPHHWLCDLGPVFSPQGLHTTRVTLGSHQSLMV